MAECHPVGFQWVMEAKARGAVVIHVDPRFTRTSAVADVHVPIRAGSDIAFLGGLVNYVLQTESFFREYVAAYSNGPVILRDDYRDTEDLDGVFSGFDPETRTYDTSTWQYEGMGVQSSPGQRGEEAADKTAGKGADKTTDKGDAASRAIRPRATPTARAAPRSAPGSRRWTRPCNTRAASSRY